LSPSLKRCRTLSPFALGSITQGFQRRFHGPDSAGTIADRITLQCHHDWIETFRVQHREVRFANQYCEQRPGELHREVRSAEPHESN
jgi:hypothetical protein